MHHPSTLLGLSGLVASAMAPTVPESRSDLRNVIIVTAPVQSKAPHELSALARLLQSRAVGNVRLPKEPRPGTKHCGQIFVDATLEERSTYEPIVRTAVEQSLAVSQASRDVAGFQRNVAIDMRDGLPRATRRRLMIAQSMAQVVLGVGIRDAADLKQVMEELQSRAYLRANLSGLDMVEPKMLDMMEVLAGASVGAVIDGRVRKVLASEGIDPSDYGATRRSVDIAAAELGWTPAEVDASLWSLGNQQWLPRYDV